jgi:hypothetical protein
MILRRTNGSWMDEEQTGSGVTRKPSVQEPESLLLQDVGCNAAVEGCQDVQPDNNILAELPSIILGY